MGHIYKSAARVFSHVMPFPDDPFIGCPEDDIDSGIRAIRNITGDFILFQEQTKPIRMQLMDPGLGFSAEVYRDFLSDHPELVEFNAHGQIPRHDWASIVNFANTKYWTRLWIVQELLLPDPENVWIFHNNELLDYKVLKEFNILNSGLRRTLFDGYELSSRILTRVLHTSTAPRHAYGKFLVLPQERYDRSHDENVYEKVYTILRQHECQNPRDSLYAMNDLFGLGLTPDYNKSVKEVFLDWARSLASCNNLVVELLRHSGTGNSHYEQQNLPSWLPDFHRTFYEAAEHKAYSVRYSNFEPRSNTSGIATIQDDILCIRGAYNGQLIKVTDLTDSTAYNQLWSGLLQQTRYPLGPIEQERSVLVFTLAVRTLGTLNDMDLTTHNTKILSTAFNTILKRWHCSNNKLDKGQRETSGPQVNTDFLNQAAKCEIPNGPHDMIVPYCSTLQVAIEDMQLQMTIPRCFFRLDSGHIGIGTSGMKTGDQVCTFVNKTATVVLRKTGTEWLNVGPCYVLGLSDKEWVETIEIDEVDLREFRIR